MNKEEVKEWCRVNGYTLVKKYRETKKHISFLDLEIMAEKICGINSIYTSTNKQENVFARWMVADYIRRTTSLSFQYIANRYGLKQHGTIMHGVEQIRNEFLGGWRLDFYLEFQKEIDKKHKELGFNPVYCTEKQEDEQS